MKKIAIFTTDLGMGGIQKSIINILNNIDYNKYSIDLYLFDKEIFFNNELSKKVTIKYLPKSNLVCKFIPFNIARRLFNKESSNNLHYDIAIDFNSYQFDTANAAISCLADRKIMWIHNDVINERKHNLKYFILHFFMKGKYRYFDEFVGVSDGVIEPFMKLNKIYNKKFYVIPNIIDTNEIIEKSKESVNDIVISECKYNLISVGRICHQKGYDIFLREYKKIIAERKDIHFYLIGDGEDRKKIQKLINKYNLCDYVTLLGKKNNPFKYEKLMDGFVLTSRYEGQGMVILEAKSLGLDIFITKNIEKYNGYDILGYESIHEAIINAKKHKKKYDDLKEYNANILVKLEKLFD